MRLCRITLAHRALPLVPGLMMSALACQVATETNPAPGLLIEGMVCVGDDYSSDAALDASDLAKRCIAPIPGATVSMARGFVAITDDRGWFTLGPIQHAALVDATMEVSAPGYGAFRGFRISLVVTPAMEELGHALVLHTLPDGSGDFEDFRTLPDLPVSTYPSPVAPVLTDEERADLWATGGPALRDYLQRAVDSLSITDLDGRHWDKAAFLGKVTLIEFWGTWCAPCHVQIPYVNEASGLLGGKGLQVLGIAILEPDSDAFKAWCAKHDVGWPQAVVSDDRDGPMTRPFALMGMPTSLLVGADGRLMGVNLRARRLVPVLTELLEKPSAGR